MSYPFKSPSGLIAYIVPNSTAIPIGYTPVNPGTYTIKYGDSASKSYVLAYLQAGDLVTGKYRNLLYKVGAAKTPAPSVPSAPSTPVAPSVAPITAFYKTPSGNLISLSAGAVIPSGWVVYTGTEGLYKFTNGTDSVYVGVEDGAIIPIGYYPVDSGSFQIKDFDKLGMSFSIYTIPTDSVNVQGYNATLIKYSGTAQAQMPIDNKDIAFQTGDTVLVPTYVDPDTTFTPTYDPNKNTIGAGSIPWSTVGTVVGVIGAAGVAYVGWLYVSNPRGFKAYAEHIHELTGVIMDVGTAVLILSVIAGLAFVGYEFTNAYTETGSVVGAIGKMTASTLEVLVSAIVEAVEDLVSDAWNFVWSEIKSLFSVL